MLWPAEFRAACEQVFGRLDNQTYRIIDRRVQHAFEVWGSRYSMNPEQYVYGWQVLTYAVLKGWRSVQKQSDIRSPYPYTRKSIAASMENVVHDPKAHEGFKRRAGLVDVRGILAEL